MNKSFATNCSACGKSAEAHVGQEDFHYRNRFTGEWEWSNEATVQVHAITHKTQFTNGTPER